MLPLAASFHRSAMPEPAAATAGFPAWVLLDTTARIGRCTNATTVRTLTSAGRTIEVFFEIADPPGLSRCFVYSSDLLRTAFDHLPCVTGADGAFVLIRAIFPGRDGQRMFPDFFVYRTGPGAPSLCHLQRPYPVGLFDSSVGYGNVQ